MTATTFKTRLKGRSYDIIGAGGEVLGMVTKKFSYSDGQGHWVAHVNRSGADPIRCSVPKGTRRDAVAGFLRLLDQSRVAMLAKAGLDSCGSCMVNAEPSGSCPEHGWMVDPLD